MFPVTRGNCLPLSGLSSRGSRALPSHPSLGLPPPVLHTPAVRPQQICSPLWAQGFSEWGACEQREVSGAISIMLGEGGGSRPGGRTGGSSHSTCEIEQHQGHDTALRPGLIHGATHSFIYGPERGGSCLRSHRKLVADQGKETRMEWNCVGGGARRGRVGTQSHLLGMCLFSDL